MAKFYVDPDLVDDKKPWRKFDTLKKAVRYARKHNIDASYILDKEGNTVGGLDLTDPQWMTHRELESLVKTGAGVLDTTRKLLAREQDAYRNRQVTMIQAGYIPIELITSRLIDFNLDHTAVETTTWGSISPTFMNGRIKAIITLDGTQGEQASAYKCSPWSAFLTQINEGWKR